MSAPWGNSPQAEIYEHIPPGPLPLEGGIIDIIYELSSKL
jgi:hypothetical protein